jgi:hypothetical protein
VLDVDTAEVSGVAMGIVSDERRSIVYATGEVAARVEHLQLTYTEGPDAHSVRTKILVPALSKRSESRWRGPPQRRPMPVRVRCWCFRQVGGSGWARGSPAVEHP